MNVKITSARLSGTVRAITSKSAAHRSLICAALCREETELRISDRSVDIDATIGCLEAMGAQIRIDGPWCTVTPIPGGRGQSKSQPITLNCRESGSTLRFLMPVAAAVCSGGALVTGEGRLPSRPLCQLAEALRQKGTAVEPWNQQEKGKNLPLLVRGIPENGVYNIEGNISSQYISGLLFMLPLLEGDSEIRLTSPMESSAYVDMTLQSLAQFGVQVERQFAEDGSLAGFLVPGGQHYRSPGRLEVESDWSNAAFFLAAGALGGPDGVACDGLNLHSPQGDKGILEILERMGAEYRESPPDASSCRRVAVYPGNIHSQRESQAGGEDLGANDQGAPLTIDVSQIPDLMPILAVTACGLKRETLFVNAGRLRMKESDRIASTAALIQSLGGCAQEGPDSLLVRGAGRLRGGEVQSFDDHRIAMSAAIAASICSEPVTIQGAEVVEKSYPDFYKDFEKIGGNADVVQIWK